jgi:hypothetical protein
MYTRILLEEVTYADKDIMFFLNVLKAEKGDLEVSVTLWSRLMSCGATEPKLRQLNGQFHTR